MIEKIMKAVKSNNKKRGRNITVGAVVGMLLSCTVVMGEGEKGLEIITGEAGIEFSKDGKGFTPEAQLIHILKTLGVIIHIQII